MISITLRKCIPLAILAFYGLSIAAQADAPKAVVAVFSQKDPAFSETITLYADGSYQQSELQLQAKPYRIAPVHPPIASGPVVFPDGSILAGDWRNYKRGGAWRLLDKEGGLPIAFKPGTSVPVSAVVELKSAMPFGFTWDNQLPYNLHGDRVLPANEFQFAVLPAAPSPSPKVLVFGGALPPLVKK